jgi:hypothetical protein
MYDHDLSSKEKFIKGTKYLVYKIITKQDKDFSKKNKKYINKKDDRNIRKDLIYI